MTPNQSPGFLFAILLLFFSFKASAQQPFYTDDADVTDRHKYHLQLSNEFDVLQRSLLPAKSQDVAIFEIDYGLCKAVEVGFDGPLLRIQSEPTVIPSSVSGIGDVTFHVKYNFLTEVDGSLRPALAASFAIQAPTGNPNRQLGTGLTDYFLNGVIQKSLTAKTRLRLNGGIVFAGNTVNGELGIKTARGHVFTAGGSLVKHVTPKLDLGVELTGAVTQNFDLGKGQLQTLVGGNYAIRKNFTFDFGLIVGRFSASPRVGAQVGISLDF